ncbi:MAG: FecR family protein [Pseudomonadota bacterium]
MSHPRFFLLFVLVLLTSTQTASAERQCAVDAIKGKSVEIRSAGVWRPLTTTALPSGASRVRTGPRTRVKITCNDSIVITIGGGTEVELSRLVGRSGRLFDAVLSLTDGILGVSAPRRTWRRFEVRTPLAIASVRSTDWIVSQADGATAVFVDIGRVRVSASGRGAALDAGQGVDIRATDTTLSVKTWGAKRVSATKARLGFAWR